MAIVVVYTYGQNNGKQELFITYNIYIYIRYSYIAHVNDTVHIALYIGL